VGGEIHSKYQHIFVDKIRSKSGGMVLENHNQRTNIFKSLIIIVVALLSVAGPVYAGWSAHGTVTTLHVNTSPKRVYLYGVAIADAGCTNTLPVILLDPSTPQAPDGGKEMYATILAATMSGKQVRVHGYECWQQFSTPIVSAIEVLP
jgi:hypothetical protein